ncbi:MAG: DUF134 domain-containing protein [Bacteroidetes bacterium]|nr:DUF134 domain-containing protein [Bacteroidota bacterium]MBT5529354.1 DUF134 domain-containing protein [Cytophagia bacterium]MBT3935812.1 DUF134 domain-containing protein [Bacteroidota bacterium]MBT4728907.1 DUF134 domain-containing protein [Bacteroidota bacterium]MBT5989918.1 DUF134 domain-containing protein [Bacteroidota bacterium]
MSRPKHKRKINGPPMMEGFKPFGIPMKDLEPVILLFEEYESIRLSDYLNYTHEESAIKMNISRPTFTRIYEKARKQIAKSFIEGKALLFEGGNYETDDFWYRCNSCFQLSISQDKNNACNYCNSDDVRQLNK